MFDINKATTEQLLEMRGDLWKQQVILSNNLNAVEQEIKDRKPKINITENKTEDSKSNVC